MKNGILSEYIKFGGKVMQRGRKKETRTLEKQLKDLDVELAACDKKVKELRQKKKVIECKIDEEKKDALYILAMKSGKTQEEIMAFFEKNKKEENN